MILFLLQEISFTLLEKMDGRDLIFHPTSNSYPFLAWERKSQTWTLPSATITTSPMGSELGWRKRQVLEESRGGCQEIS